MTKAKLVFEGDFFSTNAGSVSTYEPAVHIFCKELAEQLGMDIAQKDDPFNYKDFKGKITITIEGETT